MEIEFARHNIYDGLKAKTDDKLKKGRFSTSKEFVGRTDSEEDKDSSVEDDNEELHSSAEDSEDKEESGMERMQIRGPYNQSSFSGISHDIRCLGGI